jgi:hypothetical protein
MDATNQYSTNGANMPLRRSISFLGGAGALVVTVTAVAGCGGGSDTATPTTASGSRSPATIGVANEGDLGKILIDSQGRTLYLFQAGGDLCLAVGAVGGPVERGIDAASFGRLAVRPKRRPVVGAFADGRALRPRVLL